MSVLVESSRCQIEICAHCHSFVDSCTLTMLSQWSVRSSWDKVQIHSHGRLNCSVCTCQPVFYVVYVVVVLELHPSFDVLTCESQAPGLPHIWAFSAAFPSTASHGLLSQEFANRMNVAIKTRRSNNVSPPIGVLRTVKECPPDL